MGSPASIGESIMQGMLGYGQLKLGRQQADQRQQQIDVEKQRQDILAQQQQNEDVTHALQQGAKYVGPGGMIQEVMNSMNSDDPGAPGGGQVVIHRPVSKDEYVATYPGPKGSQPVKLAWPASETQRLLDQFHANNQPEMVQARTNQAAATARAQAQGQGEGAAQAQQDSRDKYSVPASSMFDQDTLDQLGINGSYRALPSELSSLAGRVAPAQVRGNAQVEVGAGHDQAAFDRTKYRTDQQAQTQQALADLRDQEFQQRQADLEKFNQAADATKRWLSTQTTGRQKFSSDAVTARNYLNNSGRAIQQYASLSKSFLQETQKQIAAANLLGNDPTGNPNVKDNEQFVDPFDGKTKAMNVAQRLIMKQRLDASQKASTGMQGQLNDLGTLRDSILSKYGDVQQNPSPTGAAPAGSTSAPSAAAPGSAAPPAGGAQPKAAYKAGDVKTYNGRQYKFDGKQWVGQ